MFKYIIFVCFAAAICQSAHAGAFKNFCEKHFITYDPFQYEHASVDSLIDTYYMLLNSGQDRRVIVSEIKRRLTSVSSEDLEILSKIVAGEK